VAPAAVVGRVCYLRTTGRLGGVATWQILRCTSCLRRVAGRILRGSALCSTRFASLASFTDDYATLHMRMKLAVVRHRPRPIQEDLKGGSWL
jgi:hypothetical protein